MILITKKRFASSQSLNFLAIGLYEELSYPGDDGVLASHHPVLTTHDPPGLLDTVFQETVVEHASVVHIHVSFLVCGFSNGCSGEGGQANVRGGRVKFCHNQVC